MFSSLHRFRHFHVIFCRRTSVSKKYCISSALTEVETEEKKRKDVVRYREQKLFKGHFVENLFLGIFQPEVLEYPQIRTLEEVDYLQVHNKETVQLLQNNVAAKQIESAGGITDEVKKILVENELIGMKFKLEDEGLGYFESESSFIHESVSFNPSLSVSLAECENSGFQILNLYGNEMQKKEYVPKILYEKCIICLAHLENLGWATISPTQLQTNAVKLPNGSYSISGRKTLVYNPTISDLIVVSAKMCEANIDDRNDCYTLFLVEKNAQGVSLEKSVDKIGLNGVEICDLVLNEVVISKDSIIGNINEGHIIINKVLSQGKLSCGPHCIGLMRKLVNDAIAISIKKNYFNQPLHKYSYIQGIIGHLVQILHSAESMTYLMSGRADSFFRSDVFLESVIVKVFSSEALNFILQEYMHFIGNGEKNGYIDQLLRESHFFSAFDDPNSYLKVFLGSIGMRYVLEQMENRTVKQYKPKSALTLRMVKRNNVTNIPRILSGYLHPTLNQESQILEECVGILNAATELLIRKYGNNALNRTYELSLLAELVILIYKVGAVLGRASRSLCIGLRHAETDILISRNVAQNSHQKYKTIFRDLKRSMKYDIPNENVGVQVFRNTNYYPNHPASAVSK